MDTARRGARGEHGTLRIGYIPAVVYTGLPEIVRAFRTRLPGVDVRFQEMSPALQVDALLADHVDVAFVRGPVHEAALAATTVLAAYRPGGQPGVVDTEVLTWRTPCARSASPPLFRSTAWAAIRTFERRCFDAEGRAVRG